MEVEVLSWFWRKKLTTKQNLIEFMNGMVQWFTLDYLVSLLDESVFLINLLIEWFKDKYIFRHLKSTQELIDGIQTEILQEVSNPIPELIFDSQP